MKLTFRTRFYLAVALQLLLLAGLIAYKQITLLTGERILLKTIPVDPRDLFRGDYVALQYPMSRLDSRYLLLPTVQRGDTVYVTLTREGRFWVAESVRKDPPETGTLFLRGQVTDVSPDPKAPGSKNADSHTEITVAYGLESYFVPEGTGKELEKVQRDRNAALIVEAAVDRNGRAVIRAAHVERR